MERTAENRIERMNRLWKAYQANHDQTTMNKFVNCQQWLSDRNIPYYQDRLTGEWKLGSPVALIVTLNDVAVKPIDKEK